MTADQQTRLYDLLHERAVVPEDGLPDEATLDDVERTLGGVQEFLTNGVLCAVATTVAAGEPFSVTFADIGRLVAWADGIRQFAEAIIQDAAKVAVMAHDAATEIARGYEGMDARFDNWGNPMFDDDKAWFKMTAQRLGFDV